MTEIGKTNDLRPYFSLDRTSAEALNAALIQGSRAVFVQ